MVREVDEGAHVTGSTGEFVRLWLCAVVHHAFGVV